MSSDEPIIPTDGKDSTPYLTPEDPRDVSEDGAEIESEPATMDPAEEVRLRRDLELGLEDFEQGIQG